MKCKKCGKKFKNHQFCPYCGAEENFNPNSMKKRKRSIPLMILSVFLTFIFTLLMIITISVRDIFDNSLHKAVNEIKWSDVKIPKSFGGADNNSTLTDYIAGFIDDERMTEKGIEIILDSPETAVYINDIAVNYKDVIFNKGDLKKLSSDDIVNIVKANENNITAVSDMPFSSIGDIIYNDIDKTMSPYIDEYNTISGGIFSGVSLVLIRFALSNAGIITQAVIMFILLAVSAFSFGYAGNGIKTYGIVSLIPSLLTVIFSLFSWLIIKIPVISEILPTIKISFIKYGLIFTGFGIVFIIAGVLFVRLANFSDKSKIKKAEKKAMKNEDSDEYYNDKNEDKISMNENIKSDSFSATGKIPVVSAENGKVCHVCGHVNVGNSKFCRNCGSEQK